MNRIKKLQKLVTGPTLIKKKENLLYLTGHSFMYGYLLVEKNRAIFFGDGLEHAKGLKSVFVREIGKYLRSGSRLHVEPGLTLSEQTYLKKQVKRLKLIPDTVVVEHMRTTKDNSELQKMKMVYRLTAKVFAQIKTDLKKKHWTEQQLARRIKILGLQFGADDVSFPPIVASGANAAIPHHVPTARLIKTSEPIVLDFGFMLDGYCSDFTRTVFLKTVPQKWARVYNEVEQSYHQAVTGLRTGITGREADSLAREHLKKAKLDKYFTHSLGHGTGLAVHEAPGLYPKSEDVLSNGMVFSIEPGVYLKSQGGVRIEDLVYLTGNRARYFAAVPTDLKSNTI